MFILTLNQKEFFIKKKPSYIPNINETIIINDDNEVIKWLVINKIINIYPTDNNYICINIYVKQI